MRKKNYEEQARANALAGAAGVVTGAARAVAVRAGAGADGAGGSGAGAAGAGAGAGEAGAVAGGAGAGAGGAEAGAAGAGVGAGATAVAAVYGPVWWKRTWFLCLMGLILLIVVVALILGILTAAGIIRWTSCSSSSSTEAVSQPNEVVSCPTDSRASGNSVAGTPQIASSTPIPTTTTTRAYPAMTAIQRVPIKDLMKPTFEIVSSAFLLEIDTIHPTLRYLASTVTFVLNITSVTDNIQLHCDVRQIRKIDIQYVNGTAIGSITNATRDTTTQLLTVKLPKRIHEGTIKLEIPYTPANKASEGQIFSSGLNNWSVYVNRQLNLLVPHFDRSTKHKWRLEVSHPIGVTVVTNTKAKSGSTSTSTTFLETAPILPNELSVVIFENLLKQTKGSQVEYYLTNGTDVKEATRLAGTLEKGLTSKTKPTIPTGEMFFFIVIPAMDNYQFCGRNVALVGTSLLRSNTEIQQDFVWNFIFRTVIYDKVTSADKKSSWVYEQSALFLSTSIKSTNKNLWKKHYYEIVMNNGRDDMKALVNQSIVYEDERRYLEKRHHVAKVSTILAMFVSVNNGTSTDPLTVLDTVRSNETSSQFFFIKSQLKIANEAPVDVDRVISCYVDTPVTPRLHINRTSPTHVAIRRSSGGLTDGCDMLLGLEKGQMIGTTVNKEHKVLSGTVEKIEVQSNSPVLLSGETPFSAYGYTMEQSEFDRLLDVSVVNSYDESSLKMLAFNAFNAAAEGILSYESVKTFIKLLVSQNVLSVDEAVDLWMEPVIQSRNVVMTTLTEKVVASLLNSSGQPSDASVVSNYIVDRFDKSLQNFSLFEIEKMVNFVKKCGKKCTPSIVDKYETNIKCITDGGDPDCSYDSYVLEIFVCAREGEGMGYDNKFYTLHMNCMGKPCYLPALRGLLCTSDESKITNWINVISTTDPTDMVNRQVVLTIFKGLSFNEVSRPTMFSYFLENWHLFHQKYSNSPALLGEIVEILASTIYTSEELTQFQQFVAFYGENLAMYKEFEEQADKAKKVIEWNEKYSKDFIHIFA